MDDLSVASSILDEDDSNLDERPVAVAVQYQLWGSKRKQRYRRMRRYGNQISCPLLGSVLIFARHI